MIIGGDCGFERSRYCSGWAPPCLQEWILERNLRFATFDECAVGVEADGKPAKKPLRFVSSSSRLAQNLAAQICTPTTHEPLQGKWTRMSAFYPQKSHLSNTLSSYLGGYELKDQPSCFHFPSLSLALSVYVDDLALSRLKKNHSQFWSTLRRHVQLEDPPNCQKYLVGIMFSRISGVLPFTLRILQSSALSFINSSPARRSSAFALLTPMVVPLLSPTVNV